MKRPHHRATGPCSISSLPLAPPPLSSFSNARASVSSRCRIDEQMTLGRATMTRVFTRVRARTPLRRDVGGTTPRGCTRGCIFTEPVWREREKFAMRFSGRFQCFLKFYYARIRKLRWNLHSRHPEILDYIFERIYNRVHRSAKPYGSR